MEINQWKKCRADGKRFKKTFSKGKVERVTPTNYFLWSGILPGEKLLWSGMPNLQGSVPE
jgi:hypothetical protein